MQFYEKFEDNKGIIRSRNSKKERQTHNTMVKRKGQTMNSETLHRSIDTNPSKTRGWTHV